jgi:transposase-like protein
MRTSNLSETHLHDDAAALAYLEAALWPDGPVCPRCGATDRIYTLKGKSTRPGVHKCGHCLKPFTVTAGTVMERSHIPLHKWLQAICLMTAFKKGISAHQLHRTLGLRYQTAWFMAHRIREAMRSGALDPLGGNKAAVEADETYIGRKKGWPKMRGGAHKMKVLSLVERGGTVRSTRLDDITTEDVAEVVKANVGRESRLMTDEARYYTELGKGFSEHNVVNHSAGEYVRDDAHTNTLEGYFSIFKRGMKGIYQHCGEQHLHRYLAEFDFRYNHRVALGVGDNERALRALEGIRGKRLMYRQPTGAI